MTYKMFSEEMLSQAGQKAVKYWHKIFLQGFECQKAARVNCLLKCSEKGKTKV